MRSKAINQFTKSNLYSYKEIYGSSSPSPSRSLFQSSPFYPYRARATSLFRPILLSPGSLPRRERGVGMRRKWKGGEKLAQGFLGEKKEILLGLLKCTKSFQRKWTAPISKRKESLFAALQCKIRGNEHRSINHATRVHTRFDDDGFKWFHVDRFRFLPWERLDWISVKQIDRIIEIFIYIFQCIFFSNLREYCAPICSMFITVVNRDE